MIILASFCQIAFFPVCNILVFRMPEYQVRNMKAFCQFAGVLNRAVMLFVRLEPVAVAVKAEGFMQKPVTSGHIPLTAGIIRLVSGTGDVYKRQEQL